jgi:hypothetical protein
MSARGAIRFAVATGLAGLLGGCASAERTSRASVIATRDATGRCGDVRLAASRPLVGAAGPAVGRVALFRRPANLRDRGLVIGKRLGVALAPALQSYDPDLIRQVTAPALPARLGRTVTLTSYVVVGEGAAVELTLRHFRCARALSPRQRRSLKDGLARERALTPSGPAFCFIATVHSKGRAGEAIKLEGLCDTLANAASGYGANEFLFAGPSPTLASIVPDSVRTVVLRYGDQRAIRARVRENAFWARVPRLPPLGGTPSLRSPPAIRRAILRALPSSIEWLAPDGHALRKFTPPAAYVRLLIRRYRACVALNCGA